MRSHMDYIQFLRVSFFTVRLSFRVRIVGGTVRWVVESDPAESASTEKKHTARGNRRTCHPSLRFPANLFRTLLASPHMAPAVSSKRRDCNLFVLQRPRAPQQPLSEVSTNPREPFRTCTEFRIIYLYYGLFSRLTRRAVHSRLAQHLLLYAEIIVTSRFLEPDRRITQDLPTRTSQQPQS